MSCCVSVCVCSISAVFVAPTSADSMCCSALSALCACCAVLLYVHNVFLLAGFILLNFSSVPPI